MPERTSQTRRVLHIVDDHCTGTDPVAAALRASGGVVERCADVYQGLAHLGRVVAGTGGKPPEARCVVPFDAVVLCLDYLASGDYAFIRLAKGCAPDVPLFVHRGEQSCGDVGRAMELGADACLNSAPNALREALANRSDEARNGGGGSSGVGIGSGCPSVFGKAGAMARPADARGHESVGGDSPGVTASDKAGASASGVEAASQHGAESSGEPECVRVPWARGSGLPVRHPPGSTTRGGLDEDGNVIQSAARLRAGVETPVSEAETVSVVRRRGGDEKGNGQRGGLS